MDLDKDLRYCTVILIVTLVVSNLLMIGVTGVLLSLILSAAYLFRKELYGEAKKLGEKEK